MSALPQTGQMLISALRGVSASIAAQEKSQPEAPRVFICSKRFYREPICGHPAMTATVLIDREYYEADERELALLQSGMEPADLGLEPVEAA